MSSNVEASSDPFYVFKEYVFGCVHESDYFTTQLLCVVKWKAQLPL